MPVPLDLGRLRAALPVAGLGVPLIYEPAIPSTNTLALERLAQGTLPHGAVILTDAQPAGRGRQGRHWITLPEQQILLSVVLVPSFAPHWLVMATALAALAALAEAGAPPDRLALKWPNDLLADGRKIAGILIETTPLANGERAAVVGLGLNVNGTLAPWPEVAVRATTLAATFGREFDREAIILSFVRHLGEAAAELRRDPAAAPALRARWRDRLATLGHAATVRQGAATLTGLAEDVDADGALLLRLPDGERRAITWGDVESGG